MLTIDETIGLVDQVTRDLERAQDGLRDLDTELNRVTDEVDGANKRSDELEIRVDELEREIEELKKELEAAAEK